MLNFFFTNSYQVIRCGSFYVPANIIHAFNANGNNTCQIVDGVVCVHNLYIKTTHVGGFLYKKTGVVKTTPAYLAYIVGIINVTFSENTFSRTTATSKIMTRL